MADASTYTPEFRMETADYALSTGKPIVQVASELGINGKTLQRWVQIRRKQLSGEDALDAESAELRDARKRIKELEQENAFLKKASAFFAKNQA